MYAIIDIETTGGDYDEEGITEIAIYQYDNSHNSYYVNKTLPYLVCVLLVYLYLDWVLYVVFYPSLVTNLGYNDKMVKGKGWVCLTNTKPSVS